MAAPVVASLLKKLAFYVFTDKRGLKLVCSIVVGIILLLFMPIIAFFSVMSGDIQIDTQQLQSSITENITSEEVAFLQGIEDDMNNIQVKLYEAGFGEDELKKAQVLYALALFDFRETDGFIDNFVACFCEPQTDEELINTVNLQFGTSINVSEFEEVMENLETEETESNVEAISE